MRNKRLVILGLIGGGMAAGIAAKPGGATLRKVTEFDLGPAGRDSII